MADVKLDSDSQTEFEPAQADEAPSNVETGEVGGSEAGYQESDEQTSQADDLDAADDAEYDRLLEDEVAFSWQASEYVHHRKGASWYFGLAGIAVVLIVAAILLKLWLEIAVIVIMVVAIVLYARKPPRTLMYELSHSGVTIDGKPRKYEEFRSFGVIPEEDWHSIDLIPAKRFSVPITLLFENDDRDAIVSHLELHLPQVDTEPDLIDRVARYLRF